MNDPLARRQEMKRTRMARTKARKAAARRPPTFRDPQIRCRVPGCPRRGGDPHHVVLKQHVEREHGDVWDPLNCLSICRDHHDRHHGSERWRIPTGCLRTENIIFAVMLLGVERAVEYLRWKYDDESAPDERIAQLELTDG